MSDHPARNSSRYTANNITPDVTLVACVSLGSYGPMMRFIWKWRIIFARRVLLTTSRPKCSPLTSPQYIFNIKVWHLLFPANEVCILNNDTGHSMTIVGFEIRDNGSANLLVFDPMFKTSPAIHRLIGTSARSTHPARLLKAYRRGTSDLQKYKLFELLK